MLGPGIFYDRRAEQLLALGLLRLVGRGDQARHLLDVPERPRREPLLGRLGQGLEHRLGLGRRKSCVLGREAHRRAWGGRAGL